MNTVPDILTFVLPGDIQCPPLATPGAAPPNWWFGSIYMGLTAV
jgi:hypothetical protein